jgi:hypothetical protein
VCFSYELIFTAFYFPCEIFQCVVFDSYDIECFCVIVSFMNDGGVHVTLDISALGSSIQNATFRVVGPIMGLLSLERNQY